MRPPFAVDWDALETDYIKVGISTDPQTVGEYIAKTNKLEVMSPYLLSGLVIFFSIFVLIKRHVYFFKLL